LLPVVHRANELLLGVLTLTDALAAHRRNRTPAAYS
jgi:hypothetical protein